MSANLDFNDQNIDAKEGRLQSRIFESSRIAAIMYTNYTFRHFPPELSILGNLKNNLIKLLKEVEGTTTLSLMKTLLWVYYIGSALAGERTWFLPRIVKLLKLLDMHSWLEIECCLSGFLWNGRIRERAIEVWRKTEILAG